MIYLHKDETNTVILELTSVSSLMSPFYLFEFINDMNDDITYFTAEDLSTYKCRYNRFNVIETIPVNVDPINGTINLLSGSYRYNIYEATLPTIDPNDTTGKIISTGKVIVNGIDDEIDPVYR